MTDQPWLGDACSLVDAFRSRERSPVDELDATVAAIEASQLNAFSHVDLERAHTAAVAADVTRPFGGVPIGVKQLEPFAGWPHTEASLVFAGETWDYTSTQVERLLDAGVVPVGQTTSSEFGGLNVSTTRLNGTTRNPWNPAHTTGGSSAGTGAAVAGGLVTIGTGGDGGGSIRIPAGFCGLLGMKGTAGRIPRGPKTTIGPLTIVLGCLARSVRDAARWYDVCAGYDMRDPYSLPSPGGWERQLGTHDLAGRRVVIAPNLGSAIVRPEVEALVREQAELLCKDVGLDLVDLPITMPPFGFEWAMANLVTLYDELGDKWPAGKDDLTTEIAFGMTMAEQMFNLDIAAKAEAARRGINEAMAAIFDDVDIVIASTNPDVAFEAEATLATHVGDVRVGPENAGALTIPANITGVPAVSIPIGTVDGLPVGMQVITRHHDDALLFDLALAVERARPWPLVAPGAPS